MTATPPQPPSATLLRDVAAYADGWLQHRQRTLRIPGIAAAIASRGELLLETAHGVADAASGEALSPRHLFRIASHSKTFTATAVLQLTEAGRLNLGDRLGERLPWVSAAPGSAPLADVTVEELLGHSGGVIRDGPDGDHWQLRRPFPDESGLRRLVEQGSAPMAANTRFHYSNVGYALLGLVIEAVTGVGYAEWVRAHIIEPLGLSATAVDYVPERAHEYAAGHTHAGEGVSRIPIDHVPTGAMAPATGFTSTVGDLARYFEAHAFGDTRLLSDASKRRMQRVQWTQHPNEHYGLGLQLLDVGERRLIGHSGGYPGHATRTWCDPEAGFVVVIFSNAIDGPAGDLCTGLVRLIDRLTTPARPPEDGGSGVDPRRFAGRYVNLWGACDIACFDGRLVQIHLDTSDPTESLGELEVADTTHLRYVRGRDGYTSEGEPFTVEFDPAGRPIRLRGESSMSSWPADVYQREVLASGRVRPRW